MTYLAYEFQGQVAMSPVGPEWFSYHVPDYAGRLLLPQALDFGNDRQAEIVDELLSAADQTTEDIINARKTMPDDDMSTNVGNFGVVDHLVTAGGEELSIKICHQFNTYTDQLPDALLATSRYYSRAIGESMLKANILFGEGAKLVDFTGQVDAKGRPLPIIRGVEYHGSFLPDIENASSPFVHVMTREREDPDLGFGKRDAFLPTVKERQAQYNKLVLAVGGNPDDIRYDDVKVVRDAKLRVIAQHATNMFVRREASDDRRLVITKFDLMADKLLAWPS